MESDSGHPGPPLKPDRRRRWLAWAALAGVAVVSVLPPPSVPQVPVASDKLVHVLLYALLMYCFARAWTKSSWPVIALGLVVYGLLLEGLQHYLPLRSASLADAIANLAGVTIMLVALRQRRNAT